MVRASAGAHAPDVRAGYACFALFCAGQPPIDIQDYVGVLHVLGIPPRAEAWAWLVARGSPPPSAALDLSLGVPLTLTRYGLTEYHARALALAVAANRVLRERGWHRL
jgi:hypothetical protein